MGQRAQRKRKTRDIRKAPQPKVSSGQPRTLKNAELSLNELLGIGKDQAGNGVGSVLNAREARQDSTVTIQISPDKYVVARRMDMTSMVFEGLMPMPLLNAVQKLKDMKDVPAEARLEAMTSPDNPDVLEMMRKHAAAVVIQPKVVWPDDGDADHMPANLLNMPQLMKIWNETALVPSLTPSDAFRFRQRPTAVPAAPVPPREVVRPEAEQLDTEPFIHG